MNTKGLRLTEQRPHEESLYFVQSVFTPASYSWPAVGTIAADTARVPKGRFPDSQLDRFDRLPNFSVAQWCQLTVYSDEFVQDSHLFPYYLLKRNKLPRCSTFQYLYPTRIIPCGRVYINTFQAFQLVQPD